MADLIKILFLLSGAAALGFLLGRRSRDSDLTLLEAQTEEKQRAYVDVKGKLDRCTSKRAMLERELAGLQQGKAKAEKPTGSPAAGSPVAGSPDAKKTAASSAPKKTSQKAPIPPKPEARETPENAASTSTQQDDTLARVKANAERINFDRIGRASEAEKDDLKKIKGVGPFLEKKLNALGIYTFAQIANFTDEDKDAVNEAIEFFPGRISRDNWVDQASALRREKG